MSYKLVCSDIDGTLLNKDRELSAATIEQVQRIAPADGIAGPGHIVLLDDDLAGKEQGACKRQDE